MEVKLGPRQFFYDIVILTDILTIPSGRRVRVINQGKPGIFMEGIVTESKKESLTIFVDKINGGGNWVDWRFEDVTPDSISVGATGATGPEGPEGPPGGGSANVGTATLDFGTFPGKSDTSVVVTGQAGIVASSIVNAWIRLVATADHSADEHMLETINIRAGNIVAGVGFTIYGVNSSYTNEEGTGHGRGTRIYGQWTVAWNWS